MPIIYLLLLLSACGSCIPSRVGMNPVEQHNSTVLITTTCGGQEHEGSGVLVERDVVLTAYHVVGCSISDTLELPIYLPADKIVVTTIDVKRKVLAVATTGLVKADLARLKLDEPLDDWYSTVRMGPQPHVGDRICTSSAVPRIIYRCGEMQASYPGDIRIGFMIEHGMSGSGIYDNHGLLVGIVTQQQKCEYGTVCAGLGTALASYGYMGPSR